MKMYIDTWNTKLINRIKQHSNIYIYGAGDWARRIYVWLKRNNIAVINSLVSNLEYNPDMLFDCRVIKFSEGKIKEGSLVIIAIKGNGGSEIYQQLMNSNFSVWLSTQLPKEVDGIRYYDALCSSEYEYALKMSFFQEGHFLDLNNPLTFNEKIQWIKIRGDLTKMSRLADKYYAKEYIKEKIGNQYNVGLLAVHNQFDDINFESLPDKFVIKCNHGCGYNIVVKDKRTFNFVKAKEKVETWLSEDYGRKGAFEIHYSLINRRIIVEEYIEQIDGGLFDYKIHCFNGEPKFIQLIGNRDLERHTASQCVFDVNWNKQDWSFGDYPRYKRSIDKPECLKELIEVARTLAQGTLYVRVDLYVIDNSVKVGELTFTPAGGYYQYNEDWTPEVNLMLGGLLNLPADNINSLS